MMFRYPFSIFLGMKRAAPPKDGDSRFTLFDTVLADARLVALFRRYLFKQALRNALPEAPAGVGHEPRFYGAAVWPAA